jgi:hypothetical protein
MYKIKFLERIETNAKGNKSAERFMTVVYDDSNILLASRHWKSMGFIEVREIDLVTGSGRPLPTYTATQIAEMFYTPLLKVNGNEMLLQIDEDDIAVKESLLQKYGKQKHVQGEVPPNVERTAEEEKAYRKSLFAKLEENGIKVFKNIKTELLEAKVNALKS